MYEHILIAVDGSRTSDLALAEALRFAQVHHSTLRIVHVVDAVGLYGGDSNFVNIVELEESLAESGRQILRRAAEAAAKAGVTADTKLLEMEDVSQRVADMVVAEAKGWPADLLVVGTHGRRGLNHLFLGSVAEGISRLAPMPVLLIRGG